MTVDRVETKAIIKNLYDNPGIIPSPPPAFLAAVAEGESPSHRAIVLGFDLHFPIDMDYHHFPEIHPRVVCRSLWSFKSTEMVEL